MSLAQRRGPGDPEDLFEAELRALTTGSLTRRREFAAGRACAHEALRALGAPVVPVGIGPSGEPLWPPGVRGSITHCAGYTAAAVAHAHDVSALGIDAEPAVPLPDDVADLVLTPAERAQATDFGPLATLIIFSAKESVFKINTVLHGTWLDPLDTHITLHPDGHLTALLPASPALSGTWTIAEGLALTTVALPAHH